MLESIQRWNLVLVPLAAGLALVTTGFREAWSVALGGVVSALNFWMTIHLVRRTFRPEPDKWGAWMLVGKFVGLIALVTLLVWGVKPDWQAFGLGFCTIVAAMLLRALYEAFRGTEEEET